MVWYLFEIRISAVCASEAFVVEFRGTVKAFVWNRFIECVNENIGKLNCPKYICISHPVQNITEYKSIAENS